MSLSTEQPDPREAKLPQWAQGLIYSLRRELRDERQRADQARLDTDPDGSDAQLYPFDDIPVGLGKKARIHFVLGVGSTAYVEARVEDDRLTISGGGALVVEPAASNVVYIRRRDEW